MSTTFTETEALEARGETGPENPNGSISKYWNPDFSPSKLLPKRHEYMNDPALKSVRTGGTMLFEPPLARDMQDDAGREDVAMELGSAGSEDEKPDVMDKLNGILTRQSSESGSDYRVAADGEYGRRRSTREESRRQSRDSTGHSPRRRRSKSPSKEESVRESYRSRSPTGGPKQRRNTLPLKPNGNTAPSSRLSLTPDDSTTTLSNDSPIKKNIDRSRSRSASPRRAVVVDEKRRVRDYDLRTQEDQQEKGKGKGLKDNGVKDKNSRRISTNGVPAAFRYAYPLSGAFRG